MRMGIFFEHELNEYNEFTMRMGILFSHIWHRWTQIFYTKTLKTADDVLQALWLVVLQRMSPLENKLSD